MADKKISALTAATTPLAGTEVLPIVQSGVTVKVANHDLRPKQIQSNATSGVLQLVGPATAATRVMTTPDANFSVARTDAAQSFTGDQTLSTGNLVIGTAGKGIDFSADPSAAGMTSELLDDYEEGTWTPVVRGSGTAGTYELASSSAFYTKVGRLVTLSMTLTTAGAVTGGGTGYLQITGVPFANAAFTTASVYLQGIDFTADYVVCNFISASGSTTLFFEEVRDNAASGDMPVASIATNDTIRFTLQYIV
jgi:hypothetical protein